MRKRLFPLLLGVLALWLAGCTAEVTRIRVLSYNIRHGEGLDGRVDLPRIASVMRSAQPDLVAVQEVDRGTERTARVDQPAELGKLTGLQPVFVKNIPFQGGEYGNAVLSRLPIKSYEDHYLPKSLPNEQRGALEVRVRAGRGIITFIATHLDYHPSDAERLASAEMLRSLVQARGEPVIVAGDFNASPDGPVLERFRTFLADSCPAGPEPACGGFTFPADKPDRRIDYILYTPSPRVRCVEYHVIDERVASDHRPVLAVFEVSTRGFAESGTKRVW